MSTGVDSRFVDRLPTWKGLKGTDSDLKGCGNEIGEIREGDEMRRGWRKPERAGRGYGWALTPYGSHTRANITIFADTTGACNP